MATTVVKPHTSPMQAISGIQAAEHAAAAQAEMLLPAQTLSAIGMQAIDMTL